MGMKGDKGSDGLPGRTGPPGKDVCVIDVKDFFLGLCKILHGLHVCMPFKGAAFLGGLSFSGSWGVCLCEGVCLF